MYLPLFVVVLIDLIFAKRSDSFFNLSENLKSTLFDKIDFGKVILTIREPNLVNKTSEYIYNKISQLSIDAIPEIMNRIKNNFIERTMKHEGKYYKQGIPNNGYISLEWSNEKIKPL